MTWTAAEASAAQTLGLIALPCRNGNAVGTDSWANAVYVVYARHHHSNSELLFHQQALLVAVSLLANIHGYGN
jgi:hypothetical protein